MISRNSYLALVILFFVTSINVLAQSLDVSELKQKVIAAAVSQVGVTKYYDPKYSKISYPNGDVPLERGVCTDVIVRAFRSVNIDLQELVHNDMKNNFSAYPKIWGLKAPDSNIDHRRVPNLMRFFTREGKSISIGQNSKDYLPADLVTWKLPSGVPHIGMVSNQKSKESDNYLIIHNIGAGTQLEDILFQYSITGHYRYFQ